MTSVPPPAYDLGRLQRLALLVGLLCLPLIGIGALMNLTAFLRAYLVAYLFCVGLSLGALPILMLYHLTGGTWGVVTRRLLECAARMLPLMLVLFLPIAFGMKEIYSWTHPENVIGDAALEHKQGYLNIPFFLIRSAVYFVLWMVVALVLNAWSRQQDQGKLPPLARQFRLVSGPGLVLYGLTITFAATDWVMSLEPHWYSTMFAALFATGQVLTALSFAIVLLMLVADRPPLPNLLSPDVLNDLGNLLLAFIMIWSYLAFSQFLLVWVGNLREEIPWYLTRTRHGWQWVALALILFHFALPFVLLLSRDIKRSRRNLGLLAGGILVMRLLDLCWEVLPAFSVPIWEPMPPVYAYWVVAVVPAGMCGLWLAAFLWQLRKYPLVPLHDANRQEAVRLHEHDLREAAQHG